MHKNIPVRIITREEAIKMGWSSPRDLKPSGTGSIPSTVNVMVKKGTTINGVKTKDEVMQVHKIDPKTGEKDLIMEKPEYTELKKDLGIKESMNK